MNDCKPEIMTAVPRFYQSYQKINSSFNKTKIKKILVSKMLILEIKKLKKLLNLTEKMINTIF